MVYIDGGTMKDFFKCPICKNQMRDVTEELELPYDTFQCIKESALCEPEVNIPVYQLGEAL